MPLGVPIIGSVALGRFLRRCRLWRLDRGLLYDRGERLYGFFDGGDGTGESRRGDDRRSGFRGYRNGLCAEDVWYDDDRALGRARLVRVRQEVMVVSGPGYSA